MAGLEPKTAASMKSLRHHAKLDLKHTSTGIELPLCLGHRGASARFPENTLASFEAAIRDGAEGIETDIHTAADDVILMFHDPHLDRTTDGRGRIQTQPYHGALDQLRTTQAPHQKIPTLTETLSLLAKPENSHVILNVDVKVDNDPSRVFALVRRTLEGVSDSWRSSLAPRIILGLWHPKYIAPAKRFLPECRLAHIGMSPALAREYFWQDCHAFSMNFASLVGADGQAFRDECAASGKDLYVWTVNKRTEMIEATKWGAKAILTDRTAEFLALRDEMQHDFNAVGKETSWLFPWSSVWYSQLVNEMYAQWEAHILTRTAGAFKHSDIHAAELDLDSHAALASGVTAEADSSDGETRAASPTPTHRSTDTDGAISNATTLADSESNFNGTTGKKGISSSTSSLKTGSSKLEPTLEVREAVPVAA